MGITFSIRPVRLRLGGAFFCGNMKALFDTNIMFDKISVREPFVKNSNTMSALCVGKNTAHSIMNCFGFVNCLRSQAYIRVK